MTDPESERASDQFPSDDLGEPGIEPRRKPLFARAYRGLIVRQEVGTPAVRAKGAVGRLEQTSRSGGYSWPGTVVSGRRRSRPITLTRILFFFLVVVPTLFAIVYYGFIASDRYVSTAQVTIEDVSNPGSSPMNSAMITNTSSGMSASDVVLLSAIANYMNSHNIVNELQKQLNLRKMWSTSQADWLSRLRGNANNEDIYDYFQSRVLPSFDQSTGLITLTVEAFRPEEAQMVANAIIALSTKRFAELDSSARSGPKRFAEVEVKHYRQELENAKLATQRFRNDNAEINSCKAGDSLSTIVSGIETELATSRTELNSMQASLGPHAPPVINVKTRITALQSQLQAQKARLGSTVPGTSSTYADVLTRYSYLVLEEGFASTAYTSALTDLVVARFAANQQHFAVLPFLEPQFPERCLSLIHI